MTNNSIISYNSIMTDSSIISYNPIITFKASNKHCINADFISEKKANDLRDLFDRILINTELINAFIYLNESVIV